MPGLQYVGILPMAEFPTMPFHTDAYLADTRHLTTTEHGAYLLLLITMWRNGGWLPNEEKLLRRYTGLDRRQWKRIEPTVMTFFNEENGKLVHGKVSDVYDSVMTRSKNASNSARAKWRKYNETGNANACKTQSERNAIQNQSQNHSKKDVSNETSKKAGPTLCPPNWKPAAKDIEKLRSEGFAQTVIEAGRVEMIDWSRSSGKRKHDWGATYRNWVRRNGKSTAPPDKPNRLFDAIDRAVAGEPIR